MSILFFIAIYLICFSGFVISELFSIRKKFHFFSDNLTKTMGNAIETNESISNILNVLEKIEIKIHKEE